MCDVTQLNRAYKASLKMHLYHAQQSEKKRRFSFSETDAGSAVQVRECFFEFLRRISNWARDLLWDSMGESTRNEKKKVAEIVVENWARGCRRRSPRRICT